jgi:TatD DNase family protein
VLDGYFSAGIHPWSASEYDKQIDWLNDITASEKCLAIGETGLDKLKGPDLKSQEMSFLAQIELSERLELPVIIHCVKAWNELRVLRRRRSPTQPWIYHGFTKATIVQEVLDEGMLISIGSAVQNNILLQEAVKMIPIDRLLLETDESMSPISEIYQKVSELKNIPLPDLEREIEKTVKRTFKKWIIG